MDGGREAAGVVAAGAAAAERAEKILKSLEAEKIDGRVGDLEARFGLAFVWLAELAARGSLRRRGDLRRLLRVDETFVGEAFGNFIEEILDGLAVHGGRVLERFSGLVPSWRVRERVSFLGLR